VLAATKINGQQSKRWCKWGGGDGHARCRHGERLELYSGQQHTKVCKDFSNSKKHGFQLKKLLNDSLDLPLWQRDRKKQCLKYEGRFRRFWLLIAAFRWRTGNVYQEL
jgi:hypothetical protein